MALLSSCGDQRETVDVFAASSLTDAFTQLEAQFEDANPGVDVRINFAGSNVLLRQLADGATADLFAPAEESLFTDSDFRSRFPDLEPVRFATNTLVAVVPIASLLTSPEELFADDLIISRCASGVPCGDATDSWLADAATDTDASLGSDGLAQASQEPNVRSVLTKVRLGEVDAGLVYLTDAISANSEVRTIELGSATYDAPIVSLAIANLTGAADEQGGSDKKSAAADFVEMVTGSEGQILLARLGFGEP